MSRAWDYLGGAPQGQPKKSRAFDYLGGGVEVAPTAAAHVEPAPDPNEDILSAVESGASPATQRRTENAVQYIGEPAAGAPSPLTDVQRAEQILRAPDDPRTPWRAGNRAMFDPAGIKTPEKARRVIEADERGAQAYLEALKDSPLAGAAIALNRPAKGMGDLVGGGMDVLAPEARSEYGRQEHEGPVGSVPGAALELLGQTPALNPAMRAAAPLGPVLGPAGVGAAYGAATAPEGETGKSVAASAAMFGLAGPVGGVLQRLGILNVLPRVAIPTARRLIVIARPARRAVAIHLDCRVAFGSSQ